MLVFFFFFFFLVGESHINFKVYFLGKKKSELSSVETIQRKFQTLVFWKNKKFEWILWRQHIRNINPWLLGNKTKTIANLLSSNL